jgi:hypothetical protein
LVPNDRYQNILKSNLLPVDKDLYKKDNFEGFLDKRANLIISKLDEIVT